MRSVKRWCYLKDKKDERRHGSNHIWDVTRILLLREIKGGGVVDMYLVYSMTRYRKLMDKSVFCPSHTFLVSVFRHSGDGMLGRPGLYSNQKCCLEVHASARAYSGCPAVQRVLSLK